MWLFVHSWFLWAALAAVIPLVLHLMRHRRKTSVYFPTLRFLKLAQKKSSRRLHMEHFLIWLMRTLLLLLLALAFALPVMRTTGIGGWIGRTARDVAIVWDNSHGMDYQTGNRHLWEESRRTVLAVIESLEPGDRVSIHGTGGRVDPILRELSSDLGMASNLVRSQQVTPYAPEMAAALASAVHSLRDSGNREKEVFIVTNAQEATFAEFALLAEQSDGQGADSGQGWDPAAIDSSITFFLAVNRPRQPSNTAPVAVEVQPRVIMRDSQARLLVTVSHWGPATDSTLSLYYNNEEIQRRSLRLDADSSQEVAFNLPPLGVGQHAFRLATPPDGLVGDDSLSFLIRVRDRFTVGLIGPASSRFFLERALTVGGDLSSMQLEVIAPGDLEAEALGGLPVVFLANALPLSDEGVLALENYVRDGGVLVVFPGDRAALEDYANWSLLPAAPVGFSQPMAGTERRSLFFQQPNHPVFRGLQLRPGTVPSVGVSREMRWGSLHGDGLSLLAMGEDQSFLQLRPFGAGYVLAFSVSPDRSWSDFPLSPLFLPFMHQIVQFAAGVREESPYLWLDPVVPIPSPAGSIADGSTVLDEAGNSFPLRRVQRDDGRRIQVEGLIEPGVYHLNSPGQVEPELLFALNVRREASDTRPADLETIGELIGVEGIYISSNRAEFERQVEEHRLGKPLAEFFLWLVLIIALFEWWLANRASRSVVSLGESMKVDSSGRVRANPEAHPTGGKA